MISVNRMQTRKGDLPVGEWIMDSGAFTEIVRYGEHRRSVAAYAQQVRRWSVCGELAAAVAQDWPCSAPCLEASGLDVAEHQRRSLARYDELRSATSAAYIMPVLQGQTIEQFTDHLGAYDLPQGAWVGVGSIAGRSTEAGAIAALLRALHAQRPDVRLHGFGLGSHALTHETVRRHLYSADTMAWSYAARVEGRNGNDWREAMQYARMIEQRGVQRFLF